MFQPANAQSLIGIAFVLGLCWILSENRKRFPIKLAIGSLVIQAGLVLLLFGLPGSLPKAFWRADASSAHAAGAAL